MEDLRRLRELMVETQLVPRGIRDSRVLNAMRKVERHLFMPEQKRELAYDDRAVSIGEGQTISQPYMVAVMTELLELSGSERVLEIGTGSGYQSAILGELAREVYTVERIPELAENAGLLLRQHGYFSVHVSQGDGTLGFEAYAPYDRIIVTAGSPAIPRPLVEQLEDGGIIVVPVGDASTQTLIRGRKHGADLIEERHTLCTFVPLIGKHGWKG